MSNTSFNRDIVPALGECILDLQKRVSQIDYIARDLHTEATSIVENGGDAEMVLNAAMPIWLQHVEAHKIMRTIDAAAYRIARLQRVIEKRISLHM